LRQTNSNKEMWKRPRNNSPQMSLNPGPRIHPGNLEPLSIPSQSRASHAVSLHSSAIIIESPDWSLESVAKFMLLEAALLPGLPCITNGEKSACIASLQHPDTPQNPTRRHVTQRCDVSSKKQDKKG
jgi:hypothetical protein